MTTRTVPRQVVRGVLVAVVVVAALVSVPTLAVWAWGPGRSSDLWSERFGDPLITLADGVELPAVPPTLRSWEFRTSALGLPDDTAVLADAFGGPVVAVADGVYATATGTVSIWEQSPGTPDDDGDMYTFQGPSVVSTPGVATFPAADAREREARRILTALGWPTDTVLHVDQRPDGAARFVAEPRVPGTDQTARPSGMAPPVIISFVEDGSLRSVSFSTTVPARSTDVATVSADQALDALRHHRDGSMPQVHHVPSFMEHVTDRLFSPLNAPSAPAGPITTATLIAGVATAEPQDSLPAWEFSDADGVVAGWALAVTR
ncbi:hypothetical protein [Cellulomonas fengjieae]|uniref:Uncharacterized protein n=1 Tax=Cellulomonas fengjieae TaxID=2819978 RepID=A0ABS3SFM0_9CELL|nr:hypothetical protein [Cellulomonas fengjieae]MBO3084532.1 hypothetical protein [Cellulomonas fengjieae]MBO3103304.1 hypothetical protein [Cellulomonas fengjieae]QVI67135.1 hypothetical protein KG102_06015 [Cellulomonas fengjieae]